MLLPLDFQSLAYKQQTYIYLEEAENSHLQSLARSYYYSSLFHLRGILELQMFQLVVYSQNEIKVKLKWLLPLVLVLSVALAGTLLLESPLRRCESPATVPGGSRSQGRA